MAFRGEYEHNLDSKDRLTIPAEFRAALADGMVLRNSLDPCIEIYTPAAADQFEQRHLGTLNQFSPKSRLLQRGLFAGSASADLDSAGRVRVPKSLINHADLSGKCVVVGVMNRIEVWNPERWAEAQAQFAAEGFELAEQQAAEASLEA